MTTKTFLFMALLSGLLIVLGGMIGGRIGILLALIFAVAGNVWTYWYSDTIVLKMYNARPLAPDEAPVIYRIVRELANNARIPMPKIVAVPEEAPNAFATGRDPEHGVVAVTDGIVRMLSPEELRGVLAHEITHIANRDILIQTVAAVMASAIVSIANVMQFAAIFGGSRDDDSPNPLVLLFMALLAPVAAGLIQMALSRAREYAADAGGAQISADPLALASALEKLQAGNQRNPMTRGSAATSEMFIVAPLFPEKMASLFSTHPDTADRIARLRAMVRA